jgi:hypothetical protein
MSDQENYTPPDITMAFTYVTPADVLKARKSAQMSAASKARKNKRGGGPGSGRKRSNKPRCECGKYTLKCAKITRHKCRFDITLIPLGSE